MQHVHGKMTHDQNSKPEVYLRDVIKRMPGTYYYYYYYYYYYKCHGLQCCHHTVAGTLYKI